MHLNSSYETEVTMPDDVKEYDGKQLQSSRDLQTAVCCDVAPHFDFIGSFGRHFGIFPGCGELLPFAKSKTGPEAGGCC